MHTVHIQRERVLVQYTVYMPGRQICVGNGGKGVWKGKRNGEGRGKDEKGRGVRERKK